MNDMDPKESGTALLEGLHREAAQRLGATLDTLHVARVVVGVFFTGVMLDNGVGGMCATPIKSVPEAVCCPSSLKALPMPGKLRGKPVRQLLEDLHRPQDLRRGLAIAALNALTETLWLRDGPRKAARCFPATPSTTCASRRRTRSH